MADLRLRALEQVAECGNRGLLVDPGWESVTQVSLVDDGLLYQEIALGKYKFTLTYQALAALKARQATGGIEDNGTPRRK